MRLPIFRLTAAGLVSLGAAADQPQYGQAWSRNMASAERGLPERFDPKAGENLLWSVRLGDETHSTPVIAGGRVFLGTNNGDPRDPRHQGDRGVLMCLSERTGELLWQLVVPKREEDPYYDWPKSGISSTATVEGDRVYLVDNRGSLLCLDVHGLANGNGGPFTDEAAYFTLRTTNEPARQVARPSPAGSVGQAPAPHGVAASPIVTGRAGVPALPMSPGPLDADIIWKFELPAGAGIWSHDAAHSSVLLHGDHLYVNTGTGVDNTHRRIRTPDAPSLAVFDKRTGRFLARDREGIAPNIFHCTWSSPSLGRVDGRPLVFFAAGNGIVYAFEPLPQNLPTVAESPAALRKVWQFDFDPEAPKTDVHRYNQNRAVGPSNFYGMPVFLDGRIYVAGGGDWFWGKNAAWLKCFDAAGTGDITATNLLWSAPVGRHTMSTPAVADGLAYVADSMRTLHCFDAVTGAPVWTHELRGEVWASALVADGRVYLGSRRGDFWVLAHGREKQVLHSVELGSPVSASAVAARGVLYVTTMARLHAFAVPKKN